MLETTYKLLPKTEIRITPNHTTKYLCKSSFVLSGKPFAALPDEEIPEIVFECAKRIESQFFSVDVIERRDGTKRIVEIGDGQVSDIIGWTAERFAQLWIDS